MFARDGGNVAESAKSESSAYRDWEAVRVYQVGSAPGAAGVLVYIDLGGRALVYLDLGRRTILPHSHSVTPKGGGLEWRVFGA